MRLAIVRNGFEGVRCQMLRWKRDDALRAQERTIERTEKLLEIQKARLRAMRKEKW